MTTQIQSNLMIICDDAKALKQVLTIAGMFGLSAADETTPILNLGNRQIAVLKGNEADIGTHIVEQLCDDVGKLYGINPALLQGHGVPTMQIILH